MKKIKKIILFSTRLPLLGKYINKPINLYRRFLFLIGEVDTIRWELNNLKTRIDHLENNSVYSDSAYSNLVKSVPTGFRKFHAQINELSQKICVLENNLEKFGLRNFSNNKETATLDS